MSWRVVHRATKVVMAVSIGDADAGLTLGNASRHTSEVGTRLGSPLIVARPTSSSPASRNPSIPSLGPSAAPSSPQQKVRNKQATGKQKHTYLKVPSSAGREGILLDLHPCHDATRWDASSIVSAEGLIPTLGDGNHVGPLLADVKQLTPKPSGQGSCSLGLFEAEKGKVPDEFSRARSRRREAGVNTDATIECWITYGMNLAGDEIIFGYAHSHPHLSCPRWH